MITWLASYPKSGNTWMRIFLTNYWRDGNEPADIINSLDGGPIASARTVFDETAGVEASDLTPEEIERLRPYVYEQVAKEQENTLFLKVHDAYSYTPEGVPMLSQKATKAALYLIRNPLDVAVSFAHHSNRPIEKIIQRMADSEMALVDNSNQLANQLRQKLSSWSKHVLSWIEEPDLKILVVRYEDMLEKPEETFSQVVKFCELDYNIERVRKALHFSSFDVVQSQEQEHGFGERMPAAASFFRQGRIGSWCEKLNTQQVEQIVRDHGRVMQRFGYLTKDNEIIY
ncbi:MAG: sulfotransferase domain-containing protein [Candidatus Electrothrix sp. AW3_4]|nr:sulfotransferase domain-containing protein [Candidatus Electrothrix gigas]